MPDEPRIAGRAAALIDAVALKGVRDHNERLVLSTVRTAGEIASAEVARRTGMSAQTASVITRALEAEGLLTRGDPVRGKVGKPYTPFSIAPGGAYALGLRVGRRVADLALVDLAGHVRGIAATSYPWPTPERITGFLGAHLPDLTGHLAPAERERIIGLGVGAPFELWNWLDLVGAPKDEMLAWKGFSFPEAIAPIADLPVTVGNDATMACFGELMFGRHTDLADFAYFFIGTFAGGGLVLNGRLVSGPTGNAGGMGPIIVGGPDDPENQLIHHASLSVLEQMLTAEGMPADLLRRPDEDWSALGPVLDRWIARAGRALALATISLSAILDMPAIVIDGRFPPPVRSRLADVVRRTLAASDTSGLTVPEIRAGALGPRAGALGAAYRPIQERYFEV